MNLLFISSIFLCYLSPIINAVEYFKGYNFKYNPERINIITLEDINTPTSWDWREHGIVGSVKNQEQCGSCWAFSAVGTLESQIMKLTNNTTDLSEQNMVDCLKHFYLPDSKQNCCSGCQGGEMYAVYEFLKYRQNGKDETEKLYPYVGKDQSCSFSINNTDYTKLNVTGYVALPTNNELIMQNTLYNIGPLSVGVDANTDWQTYKGGIYDPNDENGCSSSIYDQDHGVIVVGYGEENNVKYWIIRNSWSENWGEKGYMRLIRGKNACGVANTVIYPTLS